MVEIFTDLHATYKNIPSRMKAESFKQRVVSCFKAWEVRKNQINTRNIHILTPKNFRTGRSTRPNS